jgi:multicomponent Na+:H+ antiporter subunit B
MTRRARILEVAARNLYWLILIASVLVFYRGHNQPGGGFIGGLIAVCASVLWGVTHGSQAAARRMPLKSPTMLAGVGVLLAALAGIPALFLGQSFMTHIWGTIPLLITDFKISTVLLFDLGVYLCVWGSLAGYSLTLLQLDEEVEGI